MRTFEDTVGPMLPLKMAVIISTVGSKRTVPEMGQPFGDSPFSTNCTNFAPLPQYVGTVISCSLMLYIQLCSYPVL